MRFSIVDVFTHEPLGGNPLAVVAGGETLDDRTLRRIAGEFNLSETTFVMAPKHPDADWLLRSFTAPGTEVSAIGHNGLGAWWWLAETGQLKRRPTELYYQDDGDRVLPVEARFDGERLQSIVMSQRKPVFGATIPALDPLAAALALEPSDLRINDLLPQAVSTGVAHFLVPVRTREAVDRANPNSEALRKLLRSVDAEGCYIFSTERGTPTADAYARFFNPTAGISEDPATGSAAGPLACYALKHALSRPGDFTVEQGHHMGRPSRIEVWTDGDDVRISATCVTVAEGDLRAER
jgi:PhzF family phenazine biosynthesis protein